ncbi:hypothetical protein RBH29_11010 [Herbivorax sp. ANBcel31]|uniref:hypothetical protein n=1 Tax=Herbivorax sp. ANBcel31 TaxID=3069754 RepID=UPI0027AE18F9|nr:hypothetical protein [Herbivorax sp. ANBcel31]MDQ2086957.1 hypothetical protein [Herbivorax sp. ANBcel31]
MKKLVISISIIITVVVLAYIFIFMSLNIRLPKEDEVYGARIYNGLTEKTVSIDADEAKNILSILKENNRLELVPTSSAFSVKITLIGTNENDLFDIYVRSNIFLDPIKNSEERIYYVRINGSQYVVDREIYLYLYELVRKYNFPFKREKSE